VLGSVSGSLDYLACGTGIGIHRTSSVGPVSLIPCRSLVTDLTTPSRISIDLHGPDCQSDRTEATITSTEHDGEKEVRDHEKQQQQAASEGITAKLHAKTQSTMGETSTSIVMAHPTLTKIPGEPTAIALAIMERELRENAGNIENPKSQRFGHLGMMMSAADYAEFTTKMGYTTPAWKEPKEPKEPNYKTGDDINDYNIKKEKYNKKLAAFKEFKKGKQMLKAQIIEAVGKEFLKGVRDLSDTIMGVGPKEIFDYLKEKYGKIGQRQSVANQMKLNDPWEGRGPIDTYWQMIEDVREYAKFGGSQIDDQRCINAVLDNMDKIPDFAQACYNQRITPLSEWSWEQTKRNFEIAHSARADKTTGDHGYHTANAAATTDQKPAATGAQRRTKQGPQPIILSKSQWVFSYCWSCGWSNDRTHDSITCKTPKPGHKTDATAFDNKGGSQEFTLQRKRKDDRNPDKPPKKK
jgi:hypothetical protein